MTPEQDSPRPRRRDAGENLDTLLDAAARVLADDPAATMSDIAAASGLGRVTAWRHLGTREELLTHLQDRAVAEIRQVLEEMLDGAPAGPEAVGAAVEALGLIGNRYRILFLTQPGGRLREGRREALAPLAAAIRRGQRAGLLRRGIAPELAATFVATSAQAAMQSAAGDERALRRALRSARQFVEAGLAPPRETR